MVHKVIQLVCPAKVLSPHRVSCPEFCSVTLHTAPPALRLYAPSVKLFYLFIYFMPVPRFAKLCAAFSKSAKLILILIEINEVIFFWRLLLPHFASPRLASLLPLSLPLSTALSFCYFETSWCGTGKWILILCRPQNEKLFENQKLWRFVQIYNCLQLNRGVDLGGVAGLQQL